MSQMDGTVEYVSNIGMDGSVGSSSNIVVDGTVAAESNMGMSNIVDAGSNMGTSVDDAMEVLSRQNTENTVMQHCSTGVAYN